MLALKARCMEEGDSMMGGEEVAGLKDGRLPVRTVFPLGALPSKLLNACRAQRSSAPISPQCNPLSCVCTSLCVPNYQCDPCQAVVTRMHRETSSCDKRQLVG